MVAFVFPGQGSQTKGMGGTLFDSIPAFTDIEAQVDAVLGYSLRDLCLHDPEGRLNQTRYTQPALYVVNALHYYQALEQGGRPDYVAGHSLGEYNALLAAEVFDFITGLRLVKKRGELMSEATGGSMAAVIGLTPDAVRRVLDTPDLAGLDVANFNAPEQVVISGPSQDLDRAGPALREAGARTVVPLSVSAAFHSRYMATAADAFAAYLREFDYAAPVIPVIANVTAEPYPGETPDQAVPDLLVKQITGSVLWQRSVGYLVDAGVEEFREIGPGTVLTRLIEQCRAKH